MLLRDILFVLITTVAVYASIYAPQPILPLLAGEFGLTTSGGALLMTAVLLPLSFAPLFYGLLLESQPAKRMLLITIGILSLLQAAFGVAESYGLLIATRLLQGACVPAILAALTSYLAYTVDREHIQRAMTYFVTANIMGGFVGRVLSGWVATNVGWRYAFFLIALALGGCFVAVSRMKADSRMSVSSVNLSAVVPILRNGNIARLYAVAFAIFFAFMALLTFLPFRLKEIDPSYSAFVIGMMYSGYLMGMIVSAGATRIIGFFGGERRAMTIGLAYSPFPCCSSTCPAARRFSPSCFSCAAACSSCTPRHGYDEQAGQRTPGRCQRPLHFHLLYGGGTGLLAARPDLPGLRLGGLHRHTDCSHRRGRRHHPGPAGSGLKTVEKKKASWNPAGLLALFSLLNQSGCRCFIYKAIIITVPVLEAELAGFANLHRPVVNMLLARDLGMIVQVFHLSP